MSPELLFPIKFGLDESRPTKASDCYALGMTIFEVLSGQVPFAGSWSGEVASMILEGQRPARPQGDGENLITGSMWELLEHCWAQQPHDRPSVGSVLMQLEENLSSASCLSRSESRLNRRCPYRTSRWRGTRTPGAVPNGQSK